MNERPIIFSAPMVCALLDGSKTQTRRIVKRSDEWPVNAVRAVMLETRGTVLAVDAKRCTYGPEIKCPYGQPGDRLWVRETWYCDDFRVQRGSYILPSDQTVDSMRGDGTLVYAADGLRPYEAEQPVWRPSIHMPRWASRITLEITGVRVERLQEIGGADCIAEGCAGGHGSILGYGYAATPMEHYNWLWNSINGPGSWQLNPWVWVIEFNRVTP